MRNINEKQIINIRIENNEIVLFKTASGDMLTSHDIFNDMIFSKVGYTILTDKNNSNCGHFEKITFSDNGNTIRIPQLERLKGINIL